MFDKILEFLPFCFHYFLSADIVVDGDTARGRWYMLECATLSDKQGTWCAAIEEEKYRYVKGQWLIAELKLVSVFQTPYDQGWHKKRFMT